MTATTATIPARASEMKIASQLQMQLDAYIRHHGKVSARQASKIIKMSEATAYKHMSILCEQNLAHRTYKRCGVSGQIVFFNHGPAPAATEVPTAFDSRKTVRAWAPLRIVDPWMLPMAFFQGAAS
jgi:hypothetical protein